jgi:transcriptional regulator with XRE-family HTH domain
MVGPLVRQRREARGLTQTELAERTGLRQTYISQVEGGEIVMPRDHNLDKLGAVLGIARGEFYRAAGMLDGIEERNGVHNGEPSAPSLGDDLDPEECVRFILNYPDSAFVAQVEATQRRLPPDAFRAWALNICRAWRSNGQLALNSLALGSR